MTAGTATQVPIQWRKHDYVTMPGYPGFEGVWEVFAATKATLTLRNVATGAAAKARQPGAGLRAATAAETSEALASVPQVDALGTVIRFKKTAKAPSGLFVVIKLGDGTFNAAKLGGDGDGRRYYADVLPASVEVIPAAAIPSALAAESQDGGGQ